jgi:heat shock protein HslJ
VIDQGALTTLDGTSWSLQEGASVTIPDGVTMTIEFQDERASGKGGCNRFTGAYVQDGDSLSIGPLAGTRMACADEVMEAESAYLAALESARAWSGTVAELVLSDGTGAELLRFEPASAEPS